MTYTNAALNTTKKIRPFHATRCEVYKDHILIRCNTSDGAGTSLGWRVVVDGQMSVQPTTSYAPPVILGVYTDISSVPKGLIASVLKEIR